MPIDRRILSILYFNNIIDVNKIQQFLGEKDNYYEVKINDEIIKLEIPGYNYNEIIDETNKLNLFLDSLEKSENIETLSKEEEKLLQEIKEDIKEEIKYYEIKDIELNGEKGENGVDGIENEVVSYTKEENIETSEIKEKVIEPQIKKTTKTSKNKEAIKKDSKTKKPKDDDFDDFINVL